MILVSFLCFLVCFAVIGVLSFRQSKKNSKDYYLASQSVSPWLVGLSAVATNNSGYMFIGVIGYTYTTGLAAIWLMVGWIVGDFVGSMYIHKQLHRATERTKALSFAGVISSWQGGSMPKLQRILGLVAFIFLMAYASAQLVAGSKALNVLLGWPSYAGAVVGALIVVTYCMAGGIRASIWTDAAQSFVMVFSMAILLWVSVASLGGFDSAVAALRGIPGYLDKAPTDLVVPGIAGVVLFLLGWFFAGLSVIGQPHVMVRFMALDSGGKMRQARAWYYSWFVVFYFMATAVGLLSRVLLPDMANFDPELALPTIALELLPAVLVGLILAGIFAATMSTADSLVLACSAVLTSDLSSGKPSLWVAKGATLIVSAGALLWALFSSQSVFSLVVMSWSIIASAFAPLLILLAFKRSFGEAAGIAIVLTGVSVAIGWRMLGWQNYVYEGMPAIILALVLSPIYALLLPQKGMKDDSPTSKSV